MLLVTTEEAAIVHPSPISTPGKITTCPPIQQSLPIFTGLAYSMSSLRLCTSVSCVAAKMDTLGPTITDQRSAIFWDVVGFLVDLFHTSVSDCHQTAIKDSKVETRIEAIANNRIAPVVEVEGRFQICIFTYPTKYCLEASIAICGKRFGRIIVARRKGSVVLVAELAYFVSGFCKIWSEGVVAKSSCQSMARRLTHAE